MKLDTTRLSLRPLTFADIEPFFDLITEPYVRKYLCDDTILSRETIEGFVAESERNFKENKYGLWLICLKPTGETIGFAGLHQFFGEAQPQLLYALAPKYVGDGFASEAGERIIAYCFSNLGFDHIEASCDVPNESSHRVAERIGMKRTKEASVDGKPLVFFRRNRE